MSDSSSTVIRLEQFLKHQRIVSSGGEAKVVIQAGLVKVNDVVETRRRRQLQAGDHVEYEGRQMTVPNTWPNVIDYVED